MASTVWESENESIEARDYPNEVLSSAKHGVKTDGFELRGQSWYVATDIPSDLLVQVGDVAFHVHKVLFDSKGKAFGVTSQGETAKCKKVVCDPSYPPNKSTTSMADRGDEKVKGEALQILGMFPILPKLVVFDLDYTLWPFFCECRSKREMPSLYPHAKGILHAIKDKGIDLVIASRSPTSDIANTFLDKLNIKSMFIAKEIFSSWSHKTEHFQRIHSRTGVPFRSMLFFDDENRNIQAVSKMGVTSILVGNGINLGALIQGLKKFSEEAEISEKNKQKWISKYSHKSNATTSEESGQN